MTDELVKRLRGWAKDIQQGSTAVWAMDQDLKEAADRIEALTAERDQLRAASDDVIRETFASYRQAEEAYAAHFRAEADNARLREALQVYADPCDATETSPCGYEGNMCCRTARAALKGETP